MVGHLGYQEIVAATYSGKVKRLYERKCPNFCDFVLTHFCDELPKFKVLVNWASTKYIFSIITQQNLKSKVSN